ncbi:hypothetical protein SUGI_0358340 [Cryptomeria japonica]|nr:hypothetical protein SUGI_0358340 [Cryptomeria japonica]
MFVVYMDIPLLFCYPLLLPTVASLLLFFLLWKRDSRARISLPPGPPAWPIVRNIFQLGKRPHESLYALSLKYGPIMTLHLGMKTTVVVSSPAMAKEVLKTHNVLAGRMVIQAVKSISHHKSSLIWGEYGPYWRHLRRISTVELFSHKRLEALQHLRRDQKRLAARRQSVQRKDSEKDFLDVLLDCTSEDFSLVGVRTLIVELFIAGTETSTITIEWAMAEIIRSPDKLKRVRQELDEVVGCNRKVEESDIKGLPYLHAAVKGIFRLHASGRLPVPHKAESSCQPGDCERVGHWEGPFCLGQSIRIYARDIFGAPE